MYHGTGRRVPVVPDDLSGVGHAATTTTSRAAVGKNVNYELQLPTCLHGWLDGQGNQRVSQCTILLSGVAVKDVDAHIVDEGQLVEISVDMTNSLMFNPKQFFEAAGLSYDDQDAQVIAFKEMVLKMKEGERSNCVMYKQKTALPYKVENEFTELEGGKPGLRKFTLRNNRFDKSKESYIHLEMIGTTLRGFGAGDLMTSVLAVEDRTTAA